MTEEELLKFSEDLKTFGEFYKDAYPISCAEALDLRHTVEDILKHAE